VNTALCQKQTKADSLLHIETAILPDTQKVFIWSKIAWELRSKDFKKALLYIDKALTLAEKTQNKTGLAEGYNFKGIILRNLGDHEASLTCYLKALHIAESIQRERSVAYSYNNIGEIYKFQNKYQEASNYIQKALVIFLKIKENQGEAYCYLRLGEIAQAQEKYPLAISFYEKCLDVRKKHTQGQDIAIVFSRIGSVLRRQKDIPKAIQNIEKALAFFEKLNDQQGILGAWIELSRCYQDLEKTDASIKYALDVLSKAQILFASEYVKQASQILFEEYAKKGDYQNAFAYQNFFLVAKDTLQQQDLNKAILRVETNFQLQEKQKELDSQYAQTKWIAVAGTAGFVVLSLFLLNLYRVNRFRRQANKAIEKQKQAIEVQHDNLAILLADLDAKNRLIAKKNEDVTASIQYAQNIQNAVLPHRQDISQYLPQHFILYRPRDIVSGDFYWFAHKDATQDEPEKIILAVGDCTGHGVPGAFMSMIADALLNQVVHDDEIHTPELMLKEMNDKVYRNLNQYQSKNRDGMELSICLILPTLQKMRYSGAGNSLLYTQHNKLSEIKGELGSVGGFQVKRELTYIGYDLALDTPTMIYLYSDGLQDQFGGVGKKRFMTRRFRNMLFDVHKISVDLQAEVIEEYLVDWMGKEHQIDDITVLGVLLDFSSPLAIS